jgi:hypothetical protein
MRTQALGIGQKNLDRASHNLDTASSLKYPPLGNANQSQNQNSQQSTSQQGNSSQSTDPSQPSRSSNPNSNPSTSGNPNQGGNPGNNSGGGGPSLTPYNGDSGGALPQNQSSGSPVNGTDFTDYSLNNDYINGGQNDPFAYNYGGYNTGGNDLNPGADASQYSSSADPYQAYDPSQVSNMPADTSGMSAWPTDNSGSSGDTSGGYAEGGAIDIQGGGQVPQEASPSQGQQTDDIQANVNANEFVVPKDVALWKGQEFFQKLIAQSRKARLSAPAHGSNDSGQPEPAMG